MTVEPLELQPARSTVSPPWSPAGWRRSRGPPPLPGRCSGRRRQAGWHSSRHHGRRHLHREHCVRDSEKDFYLGVTHCLQVSKMSHVYISEISEMKEKKTKG